MRNSTSKIGIYLCFVILGLTTITFAQDNVIIKIRDIESQLSVILEQNDVDALDDILHPGFTVQSVKGDFTKKAQLIEGFRSGKNPYTKFRPIADSVVVVNETTVISSGKELFAHKTGIYSDQDHTRFFYHVWIKHNDSWLLGGRLAATILE